MALVVVGAVDAGVKERRQFIWLALWVGAERQCMADILQRAVQHRPFQQVIVLALRRMRVYQVQLVCPLAGQIIRGHDQTAQRKRTHRLVCPDRHKANMRAIPFQEAFGIGQEYAKFKQQLRARNLGIKKIARELGCGVSTVIRVLNQEEQQA